MTPATTEQAFEDAIECVLLQGGPDACPSHKARVREPRPGYGPSFKPGGYHRRASSEFDRERCLVLRDVRDFIIASQPKRWKRLRELRGADFKERFLDHLALQLKRRGVVDVLRNGIKDHGIKFHLAYFRPSSRLNEESARLHKANLFAVVRQLRYTPKSEHSLDLAIFLNGIPVFTAELKNPLTGQDVQDAVAQYRKDRSPGEALLAPRRCIAHFAVDPNLVYVTTRLAGAATRFRPFNQGRDGGSGNPPVAPIGGAYPTDYLWNRIWARDSVLNLIQQFVHEDRSVKNGKVRRNLIFPRYQQLDAVRKLVGHARRFGAGRRYLIQHSAGSGKSFTIAWLAHQLSSLHDVEDNTVFDSVVVVSDRRVLDRQLQRTIQQFERVVGVVENIDKTSKDLLAALQAGRRIIVTTLQKFPIIAGQAAELPGKRFAVIIDEAHSSQSGENAKSLKSVLSNKGLAEAEAEESGAPTREEEIEEIVLEEVRKRGPQPNLSLFAFTATPKGRTLELFGTKQPDGRFRPWHLYSMRQAIEERCILDVLENYATYEAYWKLLKVIETDPRYEKDKAAFLLKSFVELHPHAVREKVAIMVEHFATHVQDRIEGRAKAMIVTRSRLHAVRCKLALDACLKEKGYQWKTLVAYSGTVKDGGKDYTEPGMNSAAAGRRIGEKQTAEEFAGTDYRFMVVANKFQTGFDQPLLHTMYVDKKLGGVNAVQTLSRLNRTHAKKDSTSVLDFANEADEIRKAFERHYETTLLSEETDPNLLYEIEHELLDFGVFAEPDVSAFALVFFDPKTAHDQYSAALTECVDRFTELVPESRTRLRRRLRDYRRLYGFLSQVMPFADTDLEKLCAFVRCLGTLLPPEESSLPVEVQQAIDMESFRIGRTGSGGIDLRSGNTPLDPQEMGPVGVQDEVYEPLSEIIRELNERYGANLGPEDEVTFETVLNSMDGDAGLRAAARANPPENVRLSFDIKVNDAIEDIIDRNFKLYKRITEDENFGQALKDALFREYLNRQLLDQD